LHFLARRLLSGGLCLAVVFSITTTSSTSRKKIGEAGSLVFVI
jgi:hypothetical protein